MEDAVGEGGKRTLRGGLPSRGINRDLSKRPGTRGIGSNRHVLTGSTVLRRGPYPATATRQGWGQADRTRRCRWGRVVGGMGVMTYAGLRGG